MPWREMVSLDLRLQFISEYLSGLFSMTALATQYRISRKTAYKWVTQYQPPARAGCPIARDVPIIIPRRPLSLSSPRCCEFGTAIRRWGAQKLLAPVRRQHPTTAWPSRSTVCDLLRRHGVSCRAAADGRCRTGRTGCPDHRAECHVDHRFQGRVPHGDRVYCYPLTLRDGFSRYVLRCDALLSRRTCLTRGCFERAFRDYGLPDRIRSDNGEPFASPALGRLSRLNVWWMRLGIVPERIALGRPEQNGSHEQFHAVLKADTARPPAAHCRAQQQRFRASVARYNHERPHESLGDHPPASCLSPLGALPAPAGAPARVSGHLEIRRVASNGCIGWRGRPLFLTEVLAGEHVGLERSTKASGRCTLDRYPWDASMNARAPSPSCHRRDGPTRGSGRTCGRHKRAHKSLENAQNAFSTAPTRLNQLFPMYLD